MNSNRESLFAYIADTDLRGINGSDPYSNTVAFVTRDLMAINEFPMFPAIMQIEGTEENERDTTIERIFLSAGATFYVYFTPQPGVALPTQINSWLADLKVALIGSEHTQHGGYCSVSRYKGYEPLPIFGEPIVGFAADFTFEYTHTWDTP